MIHYLRLNLPIPRFTFDTKLKPWVRLNLTNTNQNKPYTKLKPRSGINYTYATGEYMTDYEYGKAMPNLNKTNH